MSRANKVFETSRELVLVFILDSSEISQRERGHLTAVESDSLFKNSETTR